MKKDEECSELMEVIWEICVYFVKKIAKFSQYGVNFLGKPEGSN